jgi:ribosomal protein S18 acetylase RimI-like enzyme
VARDGFGSSVDTVQEIRPATETDLDRLQELARGTIDARYRSFLGDEGVDGFIGSGASDEYVSAGLGDTEVLEVGGRVIGFCVCKESLIDLMMVDHGLHRRGYGTALLRHAEAALFRTYDEIVLESFENNHQANAFYRKNEWVERERRFDEALGSNKIVFEKRRNG